MLGRVREMPRWLRRHAWSGIHADMLKRVRAEEPWLGHGRGPDVPVQNHAAHVLSLATLALSANKVLRGAARGRQIPDLERDAEWLRDLQKRARRIARTPPNDGEGGPAGVREPRGPGPHSGPPETVELDP